MKLKDLQQLDSSLDICFVEKASLEIESIEVFSISHAYEPSDNSFIFIKNKKFLNEIGRLSKQDKYLNAGIVFEKSFFTNTDEDLGELKKKFSWFATVDNVNSAMCSFSKPFYDEKYGSLNYFVDGRQMGTAEVDPTAQIAQNVFIGENCKIGKDVKIYPGTVILPNVEIGEGSILFPNITIYPFVKIGTNCRIHASASIGTDGFGYNFIGGEHVKIWHLAGVEISNNVEIGASSKIDGGAFMPTRIGKGTKIDNLVQISHNVQVGDHNIFAGKSGVAGSVETEEYCIFAASAGSAPGARLGKGTQVAALGIVSENAIIAPGSVLSGHPARPLKEWLKSQAKLRQLIKKK